MCDDRNVKENDVHTIAATAATTLRTAAPVIESNRLEHLFREHHAQIFRTAYRITGSVTDAEDVLQTIFLRLASGKEQRDLTPNPAAYLRRASVNAALDLIRGRQSARLISLESIEPTNELLNSSGFNPEQEYADRELRALVRGAITKLGERAATVFVLRYIEGYDNREIAEAVGASPMVVAVTLHRVRTRLRREIGQYLEKHHEA